LGGKAYFQDQHGTPKFGVKGLISQKWFRYEGRESAGEWEKRPLTAKELHPLF